MAIRRMTATAVMALGSLMATYGQTAAPAPAPIRGQAPTHAPAQEKGLEQVAISQVVSVPPSLRAYLDVHGVGHAPVRGLTPESVSAWLDGKRLTVSSLKPFSTTEEGIAYVFLIDVSGSESHTAFDKVKQALLSFVGELGAGDRAAVITFGSDVKDVVSYTGDKATLKSAISSLKNSDAQTHLNAALDEGLRLARLSDEKLPLRRSILILSDGKDEGSGFTTDDVLGHLQENRVPIYAIGASTLPVPERAQYLEVLHRFAVLSGGAYYEAAAAGVDAAYRQIHDRIAGAWVAELNCSACQADGRSYPLLVRVTVAGQSLADKANVAILPPARGGQNPQRLPNWKRFTWPVYVGAGVGLLALIGLIVWLARRGKRMDAEEVDPIQSDAPSSSDWVPFSFPHPDTQTLSGTGDEKGDSSEKIVVSANPKPDHRPGVQIELVRRVNRSDAPRTYSAKLVTALVIGRSSGVGMQIPDTEISGQHCRLEMVNGTVTVSDLGSRYGTSVNGVPIQSRHKLERGDLIALGSVEFRIHLQR